LSFDYDVTIVTTETSAKSPDIAEANIRDLRNVGIRCVTLEELLADPACFPATGSSEIPVRKHAR
jgi:calcineurin-like phosphoesterase